MLPDQKGEWLTQKKGRGVDVGVGVGVVLVGGGVAYCLHLLSKAYSVHSLYSSISVLLFSQKLLGIFMWNQRL